MSRRLSRSRKKKVAQEYLCELIYRPLAHLVVLVLLRLGVAPPLVAAAAGATGIAAAVELARGNMILAALLVQLKTVLDNADGQLARLSGRITVFGRYLDSELDLFVNAALFAAVGWSTGRPILAIAGFLAADDGAERELQRRAALPVRTRCRCPGDARGDRRADAVVRGLYLMLYAPQDRLVEGFVAQRLRGAGLEARLAYHDRATVAILANLGMSPSSRSSDSASHSDSRSRLPGSRSPSSVWSRSSGSAASS